LLETGLNHGLNDRGVTVQPVWHSRLCITEVYSGMEESEYQLKQPWSFHTD